MALRLEDEERDDSGEDPKARQALIQKKKFPFQPNKNWRTNKKKGKGLGMKVD